ncbi:hypothetical protein [Nocardia harenae]|nr:hypothetical protein [Nocardia harenae]
MQQVLAEDNRRHLAGGISAADRYRGARADAETAFTLLRHGLRGAESGS